MELRKIVINLRFGGFNLSEQARLCLVELGVNPSEIDNLERDNLLLVQVVEELRANASDCPGDIGLCLIPAHINYWAITECDGMESIELLGTIVQYRRGNHKEWD